VRKLSGAERYSREVAAAIAAGTIRRAFLKGMRQAAGCPAAARPPVVIPATGPSAEPAAPGLQPAAIQRTDN
jgi:hypothetical protein